MMVVTAIFMILSGVVLSTNARFGQTITLNNLGHDMALTVRQAQVYGIAVRRYEGVNFDVGYGMHFTLPANESPSTYQLFADASRDGFYDATSVDSPINSTTLKGGYRITRLCVENDCAVEDLDIVFRRPEPDACISAGRTITFDSQGKCIPSLSKGSASIRIESSRGETVDVVVEASGQISVQ